MTRELCVSVIIPTKNRANDLARCVKSLCEQSTGIHELIVVDQSPNTDSFDAIRPLVESRGLHLVYWRDPSITGIADARNRAMERAAGDVWLFLDDDVELEADCVERIVSTYSEAAGLAGVSGLITNYARPSKASRLWLCCFVRGPFHDERQPLYWNAAKIRSAEPFPVTKFTGCLMSFRSDFVRHLRFDEGLHGVSEGEDVDFCLRVGGPLLLNPRARVRHHHSKSGRLTDHWTRRAVRAQLFLFGKHWNHGFFNRLVSGWLFLGYCLVCTASSLRHLSLDPWRALGEGIRDACMALARSAELQNRAPSDGCDKISVGQDT